MNAVSVLDTEQNLRARISAVLNAAGEPTTLPTPPSWSSSEPATVEPVATEDGLSAVFNIHPVVAPVDATITVDTGVLRDDGSQVQAKGVVHVDPSQLHANRVDAIYLEFELG